jgi:Uma2 family endonuclease
MDVVTIGAPADLIAERQRLGLDNHDEVWNGEHHMVPSPTDEHQRLEVELAAALLPVAKASGLHLRLEFNVIAPDESGWADYRVPDLVVFGSPVRHERGVVGPASLVVEIRSPGDESFQKLPFYERLGVAEVLIIDRDTKIVRRWVNGAHGLAESAGAGHGRHRLDCLPVELWNEGEILVVVADGARTEI